MASGAGGGTDDFRHSRKRILLAGACSATLAIGCSPASNGNYTASNSAEARQAVLDANAEGNPSSTIILTDSFVVTGGETPPSFTEFQASHGGKYHGTV